MEIVIDKGFLDGFFRYNFTEEKKAVYDSFIHFIKNIKRGVKVICDFDDYDELETYVTANPLLHAIEEREPHYELKSDLSQLVKQAGFYNHGNAFKMFFLKTPCEECNVLEGQVGYSFMNAEDLNQKWKRFLTAKELTRYHISTNPEIDPNERFDAWGKIQDYPHPVNSIVIADKYVLCDKSGQRIEHNLKPLLLELIPNRKMLVPVDVTIIASQKESNREFSQIKSELDSFFKMKLPLVQVNLTIIDFDDKVKAHVESEVDSDFHDRRIVTNYYWYEVGKGFNLFKRANQLRPSNSKLYMGFNLYGSNQVDVKLLLEEYSACAAVAENVHGENKNRLLNLN
ncbi:hypothetical protein K3G39_07075 [Pontibacter sp. HSC-14F20]|uniref:hypothetical protein n=1 Tax=Pontibacter sp. HSC-14F20 TaxID=2864136 RepID=UPI001C72C7B1|nr:hypothetical protein [Pontibacter sp. HSC-14F20]MBX0332996.1 hypothetical protein [Pontibacter sp. HSC-14F20]